MSSQDDKPPTEPSYHLWLVPSGDAFERYTGMILELASELEAPVFEPHVTLLSLTGPWTDHARRTRQLADRLTAFDIALTGLAYTEAHFRSLFATADKSGPVMQANALAKEIFPHVADDYLPHLSLLYGSYPESLKRSLIARLESRALGTFEVNAVHLIRADSTDPKDWHHVLVAPMRR